MNVISVSSKPGRLSLDRGHRTEDTTRPDESEPIERENLVGYRPVESRQRHAAGETVRDMRLLELPSEYFIG